MATPAADLSSLVAIMQQQFETQKQTMAQQLEMQQEQVNRQLKIQQDFLASQLSILQSHLGVPPAPAHGIETDFGMDSMPVDAASKVDLFEHDLVASNDEIPGTFLKPSSVASISSPSPTRKLRKKKSSQDTSKTPREKQEDLLSSIEQLITRSVRPVDMTSDEQHISRSRPVEPAVEAKKGPTTADKHHAIHAAEASRRLWGKCSGLHTVEKWLLDYRNHPFGWAALTMIHGVQEVSGRLRMKMQNYATFSALFIAGSIKILGGMPPVCTEDTLECNTRKRVYAYFLCISLVAHLLSILIAMAFHNALNEAARDSDVYRMFARGEALRATICCEQFFFIGAFACMISLMAIAQQHIGWDIVVVMFVLTLYAVKKYKRTARLLFQNASIVGYWRPEVGGKPDPNDEYDLSVPLDYFLKLAAAEKDGFHDTFKGMDVEDLKRMESKPVVHHRTQGFMDRLLTLL